jgi:tRNA (uracil-5-)-methyltransferase TRM9
MREDIIQHLLEINKEFYQSFGSAFAETRRRIQPGVTRAVENFFRDGNWLDVGCGSGALSQALIKRGFQGSYTGIDFSSPLLDEAQNSLALSGTPAGLVVRFQEGNLMETDWRDGLEPDYFDGVLAFSVLHHIPGSEIRLRLLQQIAGLIKPGGIFIHSEWQFQNSPKLLARIQPWNMVGIDKDDVEEGDTLLDWRHKTAYQEESSGLRYIHLFNREELSDSALAAGFTILDEYTSDGAGEKLGLYQVWKK